MSPITDGEGLLSPRSPGRQALQAGQVSQLVIVDVHDGRQQVICEVDTLIESPNWSPDGAHLIVNGDGKLFQLPADGSGGLTEIPIESVTGVNNDHVLSPDGARVYFSAQGHLYVVAVKGGPARRISNTHPPQQQYSYWLHGVSPDETTLAYVSVEPEGDQPRARRNLATIPAAGGPDHQLTHGVNAYDGPEYHPDGSWLYYNSEEAADIPGHSQIFRMRPDGSEREQLTFDERVNWFPHLSPDGSLFVYLSYEPGSVSHPADVPVQIRVLAAEGGQPRTVTELFGGQGSLNTNSWSPDCRRFAFVAYPAAPRKAPRTPSRVAS